MPAKSTLSIKISDLKQICRAALKLQKLYYKMVSTNWGGGGGHNTRVCITTAPHHNVTRSVNPGSLSQFFCSFEQLVDLDNVVFFKLELKILNTCLCKENHILIRVVVISRRSVFVGSVRTSVISLQWVTLSWMKLLKTRFHNAISITFF